MEPELIKWIIASGGWLVAVLSVWIGYLERQKAREEQSLQETLSYFTGGTQKRNVGIALVEGVWQSKPQYMNILVPVITNQIVYLLTTTNSKDEIHELRNLNRLLSIFMKTDSVRYKFPSCHSDVTDAIYRKISGECKGIDIPDVTLDQWVKKLEKT